MLQLLTVREADPGEGARPASHRRKFIGCQGSVGYIWDGTPGEEVI